MTRQRRRQGEEGGRRHDEAAAQSPGRGRPLPQYDVRTEVTDPPVPNAERTKEAPAPERVEDEKQQHSGPWAAPMAEPVAEAPADQDQDEAWSTTAEDAARPHDEREHSGPWAAPSRPDDDAFAPPRLEERSPSSMFDDIEMRTLPDVGLPRRMERRATEEAAAELEEEKSLPEPRGAAAEPEPARKGGAAQDDEEDPWSYFPATVSDPSALAPDDPEAERTKERQRARPPGRPAGASSAEDDPLGLADVSTEVLDEPQAGAARAPGGGRPPSGVTNVSTEVLDPPVAAAVSAPVAAVEPRSLTLPGTRDAPAAPAAATQRSTTLVTRPVAAPDGDEAEALADTIVLEGEAAREAAARTRRAPSSSALAAAVRHQGPPENSIPFGTYWLVRRLKSGGMADVYEALVSTPGAEWRQVAIKRIQLPLTESEEFVTMFMDEAKIALLLDHPSIVQFLEFGQVGQQYYIAMEYVHGRDLDAVLQLTRRVGTRIPVGIAIYIILQVLEALDYAHHKRDAAGQGLGIVHRDVSPANIMCSFDGHVKLTDFGVAKAAVRVRATIPGLVLGKLGYMSPEQIKAERIDHRSDIFSAAIVLWEALAGQRLFLGDNDAVTIQNVANAEIPSLRARRADVPPALEAAINEALSRDPRRRPARAAELAARLRQVLAQLDVSRPQNDFIVFMAALFEGVPAGEPIFKRDR